MELEVTYDAPSALDLLGATPGAPPRVRLAGARERDRVAWRGVVHDPLALREALLALGDVAGARARRPPAADRAAFARWLLAWRDRHPTGERPRLDAARRRALEALWAEEAGRPRGPDPLASVDPTQVAFEVWSPDGGAWLRVGLDRAATTAQGPATPGTTWIDAGPRFFEAARRLRSRRPVELVLGDDAPRVGAAPGPPDARARADCAARPDDGPNDGPEDAPNDVREVEAARAVRRRAALAPAWAQGATQLAAAALLAEVRVELDAVQLHDLCRALRRRRPRASPRALRWELVPGQPPALVLEPWELRRVLRGATHDAPAPRSIRVWGRRRLLLLERALPLAPRFVVHLLGRGLPWFVTARGPALDLALGLSGWTRASWATATRLDALLAGAAELRPAGDAAARGPDPTAERVVAWLAAARLGETDAAAAAAGCAPAVARAALLDAAAQGLALFDPARGLWRWRPLLPGGLPPALAAAPDPERARGLALARAGAAAVVSARRAPGGTTTRVGRVLEPGGRAHVPALVLADDGAVARATCTCWAGRQLAGRGLCAHAFALLARGA